MASQRIGETGLSESGPSSHHVPYGVLHGISTSSGLMYSSMFSLSQGYQHLEKLSSLQGIFNV